MPAFNEIDKRTIFEKVCDEIADALPGDDQKECLRCCQMHCRRELVRLEREMKTHESQLQSLKQTSIVRQSQLDELNKL